MKFTGVDQVKIVKPAQRNKDRWMIYWTQAPKLVTVANMHIASRETSGNCLHLGLIGKSWL